MACPQGQISVNGRCVSPAQAAAAAGLDVLGTRACSWWDRFLRAFGVSRSCVDLQKFGIGAAPAHRLNRRRAAAVVRELGRRRRRRR